MVDEELLFVKNTSSVTLRVPPSPTGEGIWKSLARVVVGDGVIAGVIVPIEILGNRVPLLLGTAVVDAHQSTATRKCTKADVGHAIWNRDTRKSVATIKRIIADGGYAAVSRDDTIFATKDQCFACRFNQTIPCAMILGIFTLYCNAFKISTSIERPFSNGGYIIRNGDRR